MFTLESLMRRMEVSRYVAFQLFVIVALPSFALADSKQRPNVLFILADDLGYGDLGCFGNDLIDTPEIDSLAKGGVKLLNHYAPSPLCSPSRAGYLTGRFNHRTGAVDVPSNRGLDRISLSERTFGDYFNHAGYATALIGKWHNGLYCHDYLPHQRGFDWFFGFANGGQDYWRWNLLNNETAVPSDGRYLTDVLNEATIEFINRDHDQPFAIFLAHHVPHVPFQAPEQLVNKYRRRLDGKDFGHVATIYAMIEAMDRGLGKVFRTLKQSGLWENTVIVFTSDNGAYLGKVEGKSTHRYHASLSGNKGDVGEQGIRVPAIFSWPGNIPANESIQIPIHGCDWLPTLFSLANGTLPRESKPFDGIDVLPTLRGHHQTDVSSRSLPFQKNRYRPVAHSDAAIRQGRWKLIWPPVPGTFKKDIARDNPSYLRGLTHPHWEMPLDRGLATPSDLPSATPKLFDLVADPSEEHDRSSEFPKRVQRMTRLYNEWFDDVDQEWMQARSEILQHDRSYWKNREAPDPRRLYSDYWQWNRVSKDLSPQSADPLNVFQGYWNQSNE